MSTQIHVVEAQQRTAEAPAREQFADPMAKHYHDMKNGAAGGAVVGLGYGVATLAIIGINAIPGLFEALVLIGFAMLGGVLFGGIIGSTGLFAKADTDR